MSPFIDGLYQAFGKYRVRVMMERKNLWQLPAEHQLEIINLALVSRNNRIADQVREAASIMDLSEYLRSENTFSRSLHGKLDVLFASSINLFNQANGRWGLRLLWCSSECAHFPNQHLWAFVTHPDATNALIDHACACSRCSSL